MEYIIYCVLAVAVALVGVSLTIFDLPGNGLMLASILGYAFLVKSQPDLQYVCLVVIVYLLGEIWESGMSFFGIKKEKISWGAVFLIGLGGFAGTLIGTGIFPILGSFLGGCVGAYLAAFLYVYLKSGNKQDAFALAWQAAKVRCLAMLGKMTAGFVLAILLVKMVFSR